MKRKTLFFFIATICPILLFSAPSSFAENHKTKPVVAVDIGHTKTKPGAVSATGIGEYFFNETIGRKLTQRLKEQGDYEPFLVNAGGNLGLRKRTDIANRKKAELFISIHHDSVQPVYLSQWSYNGRPYSYCDRYEGFSIFYSGKNARQQASLAFGEILGEKMLTAGFNPTLHHSEPVKGESRELVDRYRGIYRVDNWYVLHHAKMPAVILECGIIVNRQEEKKLKDPAYQDKIVTALLHAIDEYFR